jgi:hypothetical protein
MALAINSYACAFKVATSTVLMQKNQPKRAVMQVLIGIDRCAKIVN